jgi:ketosteroid isomerase-like protein
MRYRAQGAVYIFERQSNGDWAVVARVSSADAAIADNAFGTSVDLEGSRMLVGATQHAYRRSTFEQRTGAAYIFERQSDGTWMQAAKLMASDPDREAVDPDGAWWTDWRDHIYTRAFGVDVSLSGEWALIGTSNTRGEAYLFKREDDSTWVPAKKFVPSDKYEDSNSIMTRVSIADSLAIMGFVAAGQVTGQSAYGSASIYELHTDGRWTGPTRLALPDSSTLAFLGRDVALVPPYAFVGANRRFTEGPENTAGVYVYERQALGEWRLVSKVSPAADTSISNYSGRISSSNTGIIFRGKSADDAREVLHFEMRLP